MAQTFTTLDAYKNHLLGRTKVAVEDTIEEIKKHLMEILDERIYNLSESEYYERSGVLRNKDNWITDNISHSSGNITFDLHFDESQYWADGWKHIHGLIWDGHNTELPTAEDFINVLNEGKSELFGKSNTAGFWDEFIDWVEDHYDEIFIKNMNLQGIKVLK